jgi:hypothetical protein
LDRAYIRSRLSDAEVETTTSPSNPADTLGVVLCTYFSRHLDRPDDDLETDFGWGEWVIRKTEEALDLLADDLLGKRS